jgi:hypothetical protein
MKHLGGSGKMDLCWVVPWGHVVEPLNQQVYLTCGRPPDTSQTYL